LPTVSYLTSLDQYAIVSIVYLCFLCIWHGSVAYFWRGGDAKTYDGYAFLFFLLTLLLLHIYVGIWFIIAYQKILKLYKQEIDYLKNIKNDKLKRMRKSVKCYKKYDKD
jgi:hypothetical protein